MPNIKDLESVNFFDSVAITPDSWEKVVIKIESVIESLASLNGDKESMSDSQFGEHINNAGLFIENGYKFLDTNKEVLAQGHMSTLKENTEILLANARALHSYLEVKSIIGDYSNRKVKIN